MKNQPSIDPRERRAVLDNQYAKLSKVEDLTPYIDTVRDLINQMTLLDSNGSKKDKASHYSTKVSKLKLKLKENQEQEHKLFLSVEPGKEVIDNIRRFFVMSGETDQQKLENKVQLGLDIARETRRKINAIFA